jgi:hypothetical protein
MSKAKTLIIYLFGLSLFAAISATKAESFDPEAISQVSKGIAEWKLMNEDKGEAQVEQIVYVSSSLSGMVERGGGERIGVIKGLSAYIEQNQLPDPILWEMADKLNVYYQGNILIKPSNNIPKEGRFVFDPITKSGTIYVRPDVLTSNRTDLGRVIAHEMQHGYDQIWQTRFGIPSYGVTEEIRTSTHFQKTVALQKVGLGKAEWIPPGEWRPIDADNNFQRTLQGKFSTETRIAQEIGMRNYNPLDRYKISEAQAMRNIETGKFNPSIGVSSQYWDTYRIGTTGLPSMPSTTYYPPPNILFSTKDPFSTYSSPMNKVPSYTPTYTPTMPSSSWGRKY